MSLEEILWVPAELEVEVRWKDTKQQEEDCWRLEDKYLISKKKYQYNTVSFLFSFISKWFNELNEP